MSENFIDGILEVLPLSGDGTSDRMANVLAIFAVDEHNKKENAKLEFARLVVKKKEKINAASRELLLTLEVFDAAGKRKIYEAKVLWKPSDRFQELQEFKLVGDSTYDPADAAAASAAAAAAADAATNAAAAAAFGV